MNKDIINKDFIEIQSHTQLEIIEWLKVNFFKLTDERSLNIN